MCGRFVRSSPLSLVVKRFNIDKVSLTETYPNYNISPDQEILIVNREQKRQLLPCRWGFLPSWARDMAMSSKIINARAETVAEKPAFRHSLKKHRCLVVADGFYEWESVRGRKHPVYIKLKTGGPFGLAGITNLWESPDGNAIFTCAIITTESNDLIRPIHKRMPVIISSKDEDLWLDGDFEDKNRVTSLLKPYPSGGMEMYPVSSRINSPLYNRPENIQPVNI